MVEDDIWDRAVTKAEAAERKPGMTPYRYGFARLITNELAAVIEAKLKDKARLPHGRLGRLLQAAEPRTLAIMAREAVIPQIGRPYRRKLDYELERDLKLSIGEIFYANVAMAKAAKDAKGDKAALCHLRWRRFALAGKLKVGRHETPEAWLARLRRTRRGIWKDLTKDASREEQLRAGSWLLQRVVEADIVVLTDKGLLPARRLEQDLERIQRLIVRANVRLLPLAEKPEHWTKPEIYRSGLKVKFLPHYNKAHQASVTKSFASERFQRRHLAAVNRLGDIPLCIDRWTLALVDMYGARKDIGQQIDRIVAEAARLLRPGAFWNSYHIDSRGRLYADQDFNYARQDSVRSLYRFAHGAELGADGFRWLLIHAANCFGLDKLSFDERIAWTKLNYSEIDRVAENPRAMFDWWSKADKPFAFAAACRELILAEDNPKFSTRLPIGFDHTASGIQHLALIGLDPQTAPLVNLVDCAAPSDIYGALAKRAQELFDSDPWADYWRDYFKQIVIRKFLKAPGVSFSYAATERGNVRQIYEAHYELCEGVEPPPWDAVVYLVDKFRQACTEMLPGPVGTMRYIQSLVKDCNSAERFLEWPTPSGVHVSNLYPKLHKPTIYLPDGTEYTIAGIVPNTIRGGKTKSSAAANYVHSLDAAHLVRTVNALAENETDALCVHDCFAVRAPHAAQFHITNREELALMYDEMFQEGGPLALLRARNGNIGDPPPSPGKFDIWKVQAATYACS